MILRAEIDHGNRSFDHYSWLAQTYKVKVVGLSLLFLAFVALAAWHSVSRNEFFLPFGPMSVFCIFALYDRYLRLKEIQLLSHQAAADEGSRTGRVSEAFARSDVRRSNEDRP